MATAAIVVLAITFSLPAHFGGRVTDLMQMSSMEDCKALAPGIMQERFGAPKYLQYRPYGRGKIVTSYAPPTWGMDASYLCKEITPLP